MSKDHLPQAGLACLPVQEEGTGLYWPISLIRTGLSSCSGRGSRTGLAFLPAPEQGPRLDWPVSLLRKRVLDWTGLPAQEEGPGLCKSQYCVAYHSLFGLIPRAPPVQPWPLAHLQTILRATSTCSAARRPGGSTTARACACGAGRGSSLPTGVLPKSRTSCSTAKPPGGPALARVCAGGAGRRCSPPRNGWRTMLGRRW